MIFKYFKFSDWIVFIFVALGAILGLIHIIFGLSTFFSFLSKDTMAAWIQAIGSIAALGIAIWVSQSNELSARKHALETAKRYSLAVESAVTGIYLSTKEFNHGNTYLEGYIAELSEVQLIGRSIQIGLLSDQVNSYLIELRVRAVRAPILAKRIIEGIPQYPIQGQDEYDPVSLGLDKTRERISELRREIHRF